MVVLVWLLNLLEADRAPGALRAVFVGGVVWVASTVPLLVAYRRRTGETSRLVWRSILAPC